LKLAEAVSPHDFRLAVTHNDLGLNYHFQDLHADAERYLNQAFQMWLRVMGPLRCFVTVSAGRRRRSGCSMVP
jgi:hypothetical protein